MQNISMIKMLRGEMKIRSCFCRWKHLSVQLLNLEFSCSSASVTFLKVIISHVLLYKTNTGTAFLHNFLLTTVLFYLLIGHVIITIEDALDITLTSDILYLTTAEIK